MCLVLYIGSNRESPLIPAQDFSGVDTDDEAWPSRVVAFSTQEPANDENAVVPHFSTKIVRYAGSFEGCGCGYNACHRPEWEDAIEPDARILAGRESRRLLHEFAEKHQVEEIYACWSGDEALPPTDVIDFDLDTILDWTFKIPERTMLKIKKANKSEMATPRKPSD